MPVRRKKGPIISTVVDYKAMKYCLEVLDFKVYVKPFRKYPGKYAVVYEYKGQKDSVRHKENIPDKRIRKGQVKLFDAKDAPEQIAKMYDTMYRMYKDKEPPGD